MVSSVKTAAWPMTAPAVAPPKAPPAQYEREVADAAAAERAGTYSATVDAVTVPQGYQWDTIIRWGDPILPGAPPFNPEHLTPEAQARVDAVAQVASPPIIQVQSPSAASSKAEAAFYQGDDGGEDS